MARSRSELASTGVVDSESAKVLLVASDCGGWLATFGSALVGLGAFWVAHDRAGALEAARVHQPEVAIVELGFHECEGPALALQIAILAPQIETIFFARPDEEGELAAARDLGLLRVALIDDLNLSLARLLIPLAESVRLRRRLQEVEGNLRHLTIEARDQANPGRITLPEAERRYRETYVRSLLAETGNRREAARRAGVPYTTLCEIIRKLGIQNDSAS